MSNVLCLKRLAHEEVTRTKCYLCGFQVEEPYEWHFTLRGPQDSQFEGGLYHGRIILPKNYPFAPPSLMMLTQNGRFEVGKKVRRRFLPSGLICVLTARAEGSWRKFCRRVVSAPPVRSQASVAAPTSRRCDCGPVWTRGTSSLE